MKGFSRLMFFRRVELLERVFGVGSLDEWIDVLMWYGRKGGVFGHVHMRISKCGRGTEWIACTDEEELALMRSNYEKEEHKLFGKGEPVAFSERARRKMIETETFRLLEAGVPQKEALAWISEKYSI